MAELVPFRAYRYNREKIADLADVVTQPYDKISEEMWQAYIRKHRYNIVRVIKNHNYQQAGDYLNQWIKSGVMQRDRIPSIYPYEQEFNFEGETFARLGLIGLVPLDEAESTVKGHENIMKDPLDDRLNLIRSSQSNEGLIFTLYSDPSLQVEKLLSDFRKHSPLLADLKDEYGVRHRLWQLSEETLLQQITEQLKDKPLYIADGHHRFQTSLIYHRECQEKGWRPSAPESFDKRMVAVFNMESPALKILPTHRGVRNLKNLDARELLSDLERHFQIQSLAGARELDFLMQQPGMGLGMAAADGRFYLLTLTQSALADPEFMPGVKGPSRQLDVNVLHHGILQPLLGIGERELARQQHVDFFRDRRELMDGLHGGRYQLAFLLRPTRLDQVREISELGEKMPPKSTDFYPKLLTGLTVMKMEIDHG